jgi:hypothetical protein
MPAFAFEILPAFSSGWPGNWMNLKRLPAMPKMQVATGRAAAVQNAMEGVRREIGALQMLLPR